MSSINNIWDKIFEYWQIHEPNFLGCNGATDKEILEFEKYLEFKLPDDFKESLKRCNNNPSKFEKSSCLFTGGGGKLFYIKEIEESYKEMNLYKFFDGEAMPYEKIDSLLEADFTWSKYLIPIYSWNCDIYALIDLRPESNNYGQILYEDPEFGTLGIWADSYEDFLQSIADAILDHGAFNHDDIKKVRDRINCAVRNK